MYKLLISLIALLSIYNFSLAQDSQAKHIQFKAFADKLQIKKGDSFKVKIETTIDEFWYTYGLTEKINAEGIGPATTTIALLPAESAELIGEIKANEMHIKYDEGFLFDIDFFKGKTNFVATYKALKDLDLSKSDYKMEFYAQLCDTARCLEAEPFEISFEKNAITIEDIAETNVIDHRKDKKDKQKEVLQTESQSEIENAKKEGVWSFLWFAMSAGALALLTPCVFPMVPITVSFFTKRNEKGHGTGLRDSIVYALGIIITFTGLGVILAFILGATGIRDFAANPILNLMIAILFIVFALNLFGAFEIQIPTSIMNKLHSKSQSGSGITSVLLMGLTFSLTSFTCTVPFVGSALFSASQGDWFHPIVGMLGFSTVFAAPFFLLALFPSAMTKLPKAGGWMNNIKVVMGFMEIAAALKFISNADLVWDWGFLSRELFLAIWIAIGILVTLYILGVYSLKLDSKVDRIGAPRAVFAILFFSFSFYLIPGLLGKPVGELDAFLPPNTHLENTIVAGNGSQSVSLEWIKEYDKVIEEGKKQNKTVFLDFTGWTCTNCRWMEANVFPDPEVQALFSKMVLGKLYTDRNKEPELSNKKVQKERFQSVEMPLYVLLTPDGELIATKAFTRNKQEFIDFLKKGVK